MVAPTVAEIDHFRTQMERGTLIIGLVPQGSHQAMIAVTKHVWTDPERQARLNELNARVRASENLSEEKSRERASLQDVHGTSRLVFDVHNGVDHTRSYTGLPGDTRINASEQPFTDLALALATAARELEVVRADAMLDAQARTDQALRRERWKLQLERVRLSDAKVKGRNEQIKQIDERLRDIAKLIGGE